MNRLGQLLSWMAYWIAAMVAILALGAYAGGGALSWIGVATFFIVAAVLWLCGHCLLLSARRRR